MRIIRIDSPSDVKAKQKFSLKSIIELTPNQFANLKPLHKESLNTSDAKSPLFEECSKIADGLLNGFTCSHLTNAQIESFLEKNGFKKTEVTEKF